MALIIAVDGPSGSGKSSTARGVATSLGLAYLDTGAMYRAITWAVLDAGVDPDDAAAVAAFADGVVITSGTDPGAPAIHVGPTDVSAAIRTDAVTAAVSAVSAVPHVRELMVARQREAIAGEPGGIVVEGRDIGTTVAPDAPLKVFLVADAEARAARRAAELGDGHASATREALEARDRKDSSRATSPLQKADDAVLVDGTFMTLDEVVAHVVGLAQRVVA